METVLLVKNDRAGLGLIYLTSTVVVGLAVAALGVATSRVLVGARR
jgi:fluoride ion exporter CrcB/FEX